MDRIPDAVHNFLATFLREFSPSVWELMHGLLVVWLRWSAKLHPLQCSATRPTASQQRRSRVVGTRLASPEDVVDSSSYRKRLT